MTVVARPADRDALVDLVFRETTTIGVRYIEMARECLERETVTVEHAAWARCGSRWRAGTGGC